MTVGRPRSRTREPLDPDYDEDGSPKYDTEAERAAGWAQANHAPHPEAISSLDPAEAAAAHMWDQSGAVEAGIRPRWSDAVNAPTWTGPVAHTRRQAQLAVSGARGVIAAQILTDAAEALSVAARGRHAQYVLANRDDTYLLKVRASEYLEGAR